MLGVSKGNYGGHRGDWWSIGELQGKVEAKKVAYKKLVESNNEEEKRTNRERYKTTKNEARVEVTTAKMTAFEHLYEELEDKGEKISCIGSPR